MSDMNLLDETISYITRIGKKISDIDFIGSSNGEYACDWDTFVSLANVDYDSGYGGNEVAGNLVIVFKDGTWLSRGEYDGSEWWEFNEVPKRSNNPKTITNLLNNNHEDSVS